MLVNQFQISLPPQAHEHIVLPSLTLSHLLFFTLIPSEPKLQVVPCFLIFHISLVVSSFAILSFSQCVYLSTSVLYSVVVHFLRGILLVIIVSFKSLSHLESLSVLNFAELVSGVKINWLFDTIFILYILAASFFSGFTYS